MSASKFDVTAVRKQFPALDRSQVYFDNAGGSQILGDVAESVSGYLMSNNVQLGATYKIGKLSTEKYYAGVKAAAEYVNASPDEIVMGPSTTQLFRNLSYSLLPKLKPTSELILSSLDHEANISSWVSMAKILNLTVKWWNPDVSENPHLRADTLKPLLSPNTALVTCTHASNILGSITAVREIADLVHTIPGALLCVDGVAYAPHRPLDMKALGVDFYSFSWYKVFGPHVAQLYARREAQDAAMASLGHYFKDGTTLEDKLGLAAASYELVQSLPIVTDYLAGQGWPNLVKHEELIQEVLLKYLRSKPEVYVIQGVPECDATKRVPVISFTIKGRNPREVVEKVEGKSEFGFRWGHFYSKRLVDNVLHLGEEGVVRVSLVHYNTVEEVKSFVAALDEEVCGK